MISEVYKYFILDIKNKIACTDKQKIKYDNLIYSEHAMEIGATSRAMAYVGITAENGKTYWGAGMDTDIITASIKALISAVNRMD